MADIFISYARADHAAVESLSSMLEASGHTVWWDRHIRGGSAFAKNIEHELQAARIVIVAWSEASNQSDWVKDEAALARDKGKLLPIRLDKADQPLGFRQYQTIDFASWKGDTNAAPAKMLLSTVAERLGAPAPIVNDPPREASVIARIKDRPATFSAGLAATILVLALLAYGLPRLDIKADPQRLVDPAASEGEAVAIAVLPFTDMSAEGDQGYFSDGISEELLNVLVRVDGFKVASRTSAFALKNEALSIGEIARRLGVDYVVEGSVRKSENEIRITAQLIETSSDRHLWSDTYDRHLSDIFRIQDEIATAVVEALRAELGVARSANIEIKPATEDLTAYEMYLKAREHFTARKSGDDVRESLRLSEEAIRLDPNFARGWEGLAAVYAIATSWGINDRDYSALAMDAAAKALALDPQLSMPYAVIGLAYRTHYPTPWKVSIDNLKKAVENDSKNTSAWLWLGMDYMSVANHEGAIDAFSKCVELDPAYSLCRKYRSISYLFNEQNELAFEDAEKNAEAGFFFDFDVYIPPILARGDRFTAFTVSRFINWRGGFPHKDYIDALSDPDNIDPAAYDRLKTWAATKKFNVLDETNVLLAYRAYGDITVDTFDNDYEDLWLPAYAHFRKSEKFKELARALGLVDYWQEVGFPEQCRTLSDNDFECD